MECIGVGLMQCRRGTGNSGSRQSCGAAAWGNVPASHVGGCRALCYHRQSGSVLHLPGRLSPQLLPEELCPLSNQFCSQHPAPSCPMPTGTFTSAWERFQTSSLQDRGWRLPLHGLQSSLCLGLIVKLLLDFVCQFCGFGSRNLPELLAGVACRKLFVTTARRRVFHHDV